MARPTIAAKIAPAMGAKADPIREAIARLPDHGPVPHARYAEYVPRLLESLRKRPQAER